MFMGSKFLALLLSNLYLLTFVFRGPSNACPIYNTSADTKYTFHQAPRFSKLNGNEDPMM